MLFEAYLPLAVADCCISCLTLTILKAVLIILAKCWRLSFCLDFSGNTSSRSQGWLLCLTAILLTSSPLLGSGWLNGVWKMQVLYERQREMELRMFWCHSWWNELCREGHGRCCNQSRMLSKPFCIRKEDEVWGHLVWCRHQTAMDWWDRVVFMHFLTQKHNISPSCGPIFIVSTPQCLLLSILKLSSWAFVIFFGAVWLLVPEDTEPEILAVAAAAAWKLGFLEALVFLLADLVRFRVPGELRLSSLAVEYSLLLLSFRRERRSLVWGLCIGSGADHQLH